MEKLHVIIPAAGLGTRMRPLSNGLSKTLIPLNGKPILAWILDLLNNTYDGKKCDIEQIIIVTNGSGDIKNFIDTVYKNTQIYNKIKLTVQNEEETFPGPGGAIIAASKYIKSNSNCLIWLGDTVCLYKDFKFDKSFLGISNEPSSTVSKWCIPFYDEEHTLNFINKPSPDLYSETDTVEALVGIYYLKNFTVNKHKYLDRNSEIEISELILDWYNKSKSEIIFEQIGSWWYDCGELGSFYKSRALLMNEACREQSGLNVSFPLGTITKYANTISGIDKLDEEYNWYKERTGNQLLFLPKIINYTKNSYTMEFSSGSTLSDIFIYENVPNHVFYSLLERAINIYHNYFIGHDYINSVIVYTNIVNSFYWYRMDSRLTHYKRFYKELCDTYDINTIKHFLKTLSKNMIDNYSDKLKTSKSVPVNLIRTDTGYNIHGDFHLGNILYDAMTCKYTFLDPRGGEMYSCFADTYYDMAKLYHDILCGYMLILKGLYTIENEVVTFPKQYQDKLSFLEKKLDKYLTEKYNYNCELIKKLAIMQLLTCIPFHKDNLDRCKAFLFRALNLMKFMEK